MASTGGWQPPGSFLGPAFLCLRPDTLRHDSPGHYFWTPARWLNLILGCFLKGSKKSFVWVKVWFLDCFNFCIPRFLFFSLFCQRGYCIPLGYEKLRDSSLNMYQNYSASTVGCPGHFKDERTVNRYLSKA